MDRLKKTTDICLVLAVVVFLSLLPGINPLFAVENLPVASEKRPEALILLPTDMNAVVVEKKTQQVFLFSSNNQGVHEQLRFPCSTGASPGIKVKSGDQKTPEGVYFLTDEYEDRYLSPVYGKKAFPTDYPNFIDRRKGKNGSAIWLHGTNKPLKPMDSNGCVAMNNQDILTLARYVMPGATPVVMVDTIVYADSGAIDRERQALLSLVSTWKQSMESGTYHEYLSVYDSDYFPDIQWWKSWWDVRQRAAKEQIPFDVSIGSPGIYKEKGIFVVFLDMEIEIGNQRQALGKRKLFVEKKGADYRITGDLFQTFPKGEIGHTGIVAEVAETLYHRATAQPTLQETVDKWLLAWSQKDLKAYADFYSPRFFSDGMNKEKWVERKARLAEKYDYLRVVGSRFKIHKGDDQSVVSFVQDYRSSDFKEKGIKHLVLVKEEERWRIYRESWRKN